MSCVSSTSIFVLFNGGGFDSFQPSRGISQRGSLSAYIFILCMEVLKAFISEKYEANLWNLVRASRCGIAFFQSFLC